MGDSFCTEYYGMNNQGIALSSISSCSSIHRPDLCSCHRCGVRFPVDSSIDRFQILESLWRIVLLCYDCLDFIRSAKVCSYCFLEFPELEKGLISCIICLRRVHRSCVPLHHRNLWSSHLDMDKFMCVDCCPFQRFQRTDASKSGLSASQSGFSYLLEDLFREEKLILENKVTGEGKRQKIAVKKEMVVRDSTEVMKKEEGTVQLGSTLTNFTVSDKQLALQLHRSMNGSIRNSRSLCPKGKTCLTISRRVRESVSRIVDSNSCGHHNKVEFCSEDKSLLVDSESAQSILTSSLFEVNDKGMSKKIDIHNTEGLASFSLKEREICLESPDSTSDESNFGSILLPLNSLKSQSNNNKALKEYKFDVGEGFPEILRKTIDASGLDRYMKQYFRQRCSSRRFIGS